MPFLEMSSRGSTEKTPKIKGLVKRCRSFKEDIISRLARNRSLAKDDKSPSSGGSGGWASGGTSPIPSDTENADPIVLIAHRLKEAYLTLQFVESLIAKNCVDLLGGSSNVMLDLMGHLLNDVKGLTALSQTSAYQATIAQLKNALGDFLTAIDVLLLKEWGDEVQKEMYFEKVLDTMKATREALARLKCLVEAKENGGHFPNSVRHHSTSAVPLSTKTSTSSCSSSTNASKHPRPLLVTSTPTRNSLHSPSSRSDGGSSAALSPFPVTLSPLNASTSNSSSTEEKRPPLPPKLRQWSAKSFDAEWSSSPNPAGIHHSHSSSSTASPLVQLVSCGGSALSPRHQSLLSQWLESSQSHSSFHHSKHHRSHSQHGGQGRLRSGTHHHSSSEAWTESSIYVNKPTNNPVNRSGNATAKRTYSDSYQLEDSVESLDRLELTDCGSASGRSCSGTHNSQSISLGSSLDNLLLVDSHSQQGLSPNSRSSGTGTGNRQSSSSGGLLLGGYDPSDNEDVFEKEQQPPKVPEKQNRGNFILGNGNRCPSPYENVNEQDLATWHGQTDQPDGDQGHGQGQHQAFMSYSESRHTLVDSDDRPPLPPKKKHSLIAAYVEFLHNFESYQQQCQQQKQQQQQSQRHSFFHGNSNTNGNANENEECLEAAENRQRFRKERSATLANPLGAAGTFSVQGKGAYSCYHQFSAYHFSEESESSGGNGIAFQELSPCSDENNSFENGLDKEEDGAKPPSLPPKKLKHPSGKKSPSFEETQISPLKIPAVVTPAHSAQNSIESPQLSIDESCIDIYLTEAYPMLVPNDLTHPQNQGQGKKHGHSHSNAHHHGEGPEIKGGEPHLLIVYAASPDLKDVKFREVFLLTYRTFVRPMDTINLLWKRYQHFEKRVDRPSIVHSRATLDLFVDVVNSLTPMDLEEEMVGKLRECIYHLVSTGEIQGALKARKGLIHKYQIRQKLLSPKPAPVTLGVTAEGQSLLQWGATSIAQQMTLLDAELFRILDPAELLLWAREQVEDYCPALNNFTEHFNKVSYWARSKVLLCSNSRERNRTMKKMIEVMRKLREYNNFNSLLAVLAALDSAPIRRLGFSRRLTEALKPHAALTDSSGSFRAYRHALADSKPPCIPYIGLVLQDLTFVHIGNADLLLDGKVNWIKRWQQFVVLEPVRRFHACNYGFVRNDPLLTFLNNFDESLNDDELWALSESIKPRSKC